MSVLTFSLFWDILQYSITQSFFEFICYVSCTIIKNSLSDETDAPFLKYVTKLQSVFYCFAILGVPLSVLRFPLMPLSKNFPQYEGILGALVYALCADTIRERSQFIWLFVDEKSSQLVKGSHSFLDYVYEEGLFSKDTTTKEGKTLTSWGTFYMTKHYGEITCDE